MRKTVSIIVFITGLISSAYLYPPSGVKCDQYRNGTFYYHFKMNEKISHFTLTRNDSTQAEVNNDNGNIALYNIRWIDSCSYELKFIEGTEKLPENLLSLKKKMVIKTTILAGTNEYYLFKSTSNLNDGVLSDTIWLKK